MRSEPITKGLREYVDLIYDHGAISALDHGVLLDYADHIDEEYKNRLAAFYPVRDEMNCERTYQILCRMCGGNGEKR